MKIYFYSNQYLNNPDAKDAMLCFKKAGADVLNNLSPNVDGGVAGGSLDRVDAFVFQGDKLDTKASYLIALVLAQNKEVLCLLPKGAKLDTSLKDLEADSKLAKKIHIELYSKDDLKEKILSFLKIIDNGSIRNLFNIKYTLRISGKIADYLNWKANKENIKKADWIRDQIQCIVQDDKEYQEFLNNKFNG
ncbi:MAG: hypothetical protein WCS88_04175 [Patescibacteria group bacterium]|jgi:hypothetical protein